MNRKLLTEELNRMKYLFNHERGVVISENRKDKTNWGGGTKGKINLLPAPDIDGNSLIATNVGYNNVSYNMSYGSKLPSLTEYEKKSETFTFEGFNFTDTVFPYPDNMIGPKFEDYPSAKQIYDTFIRELSIFINKGGFDKIRSIKIQGTADSAAPNTRIPRKPSQEGQPERYDSLDHNLVGDSQAYGGDSNPETMNLYLANNRAKVLGQMIIGAISGRTGKDITSKIVYEPGINYYGQEDKRGQQYRGVSVKPDYEPLTIKIPDPEEGDTETGGTSGYIDLLYDGRMGKLPAKQINNNTIGVRQEDIPENLKNMPTYIRGTLNGNTELDGEIKGSELFVGGISYGNFVEVRSGDMGQYSDRAETLTKYITEDKLVKVGEKDGYVHVRNLRFSLVKI